MADKYEEVVVSSTVCGSNPDVPWIEVIECTDGSTVLRQHYDSDNSDQVRVDKSQIAKLVYVLAMRLEMIP